MFSNSYKSFLRNTLVLGLFSGVSASAFAGGCEDDNQRELPFRDTQSCAAGGGSWYTCTRGPNNNYGFIRNRNFCVEEGGTWQLVNAAPKIFSSVPVVRSQVAEFNGKRYFVGDDGQHGSELWATDGTPEGTVLVKNITADGGSIIENFTVAVGKLFFTVGDTYSNQTVWATDGTTEGTVQLGSGNSRTSDLKNDSGVINGKFLFQSGNSIYLTDGTVNGTTELRNDVNLMKNVSAVGDLLLFEARGGAVNKVNLWVSDGTANGTNMVKEIYPGRTLDTYDRITLDDKLFFRAKNFSTNELYESDGTAEGTKVTAADSGYYGPSYYKDKVIFSTKDGIKFIDGVTSNVTTVPINLELITADRPLAWGDKIVFGGLVSSNRKRFPFVLDVDSQTYTHIDNIGLSGGSTDVRIVTLEDKFLFVSSYETNLWQSDGTLANTRLLSDVNSSGPDRIDWIKKLGDKVYFSPNYSSGDKELWVTDGTEQGTKKIEGVSVERPIHDNNIELVGDDVYLFIDNQLWRIDPQTDSGELFVDSSIVESNSSIEPFKAFTISQNDEDLVALTLAIDNSALGTLSMTSIAQTTLANAQSQLQAVSFNAASVTQESQAVITITSADDKGATSTFTHTIKIVPPTNNPPVVTIEQSVTGQMNTPKTIAYFYNDPEQDSVSASVKSQAQSGQVTIKPQSVVYTPNNGFFGRDEFVLSFSDGNGGIVDKTIVITIAENLPPSQISIDSKTIVALPGKTKVAGLSVTDPDNDTVSLSIIAGNDDDLFAIDADNNLTITRDIASAADKFYTLKILANDGINEEYSDVTFFIAAPLTFNYQGFLSKSGVAVNDTLNMTFNIYREQTGGESIWNSLRDVLITQGVYNVELGADSDKTLNEFDLINNTYYLGISINGSQEMKPRQKIKASGFVKQLSDRLRQLEQPVISK